MVNFTSYCHHPGVQSCLVQSLIEETIQKLGDIRQTVLDIESETNDTMNALFFDDDLQLRARVLLLEEQLQIVQKERDKLARRNMHLLSECASMKSLQAPPLNRASKPTPPPPPRSQHQVFPSHPPPAAPSSPLSQSQSQSQPNLHR